MIKYRTKMVNSSFLLSGLHFKDLKKVHHSQHALLTKRN